MQNKINSSTKKVEEFFYVDLLLKRLVITIIVMLILAGVSLNAIIGDNGIINSANYASFLADMLEVQEAFDVWKVSSENNNYNSGNFPVTRLVKQSELYDSERLIGEIGYYRNWTICGTKPVENINSSTNDFNNAFSTEIVCFPAGAQDLYILDNKKLDIKQNKKYYIDATNSIIYSATGFDCNGIRGYSLDMVKALLYGSNNEPSFASMEIVGSGSEHLAGNTEPEYLLNADGTYQIDENGDKIKNPKYNPNGFRLIGSRTGKNLYKLYNNGDLYGKGVVSIGLDCSEEEIDAISSGNFKKFKVPDGFENYKKIYFGVNTLFIITENDELFAWGDNTNNKSGLTSDQRQEFTGREPMKINLPDKIVVKNIFDFDNSTFILSEKNVLYAAGSNNNGKLGIDATISQINNFTKVQGLEENVEVLKMFVNRIPNMGSNYTYLLDGNGNVYRSTSEGKFEKYFEDENIKFVNLGFFGDGNNVLYLISDSGQLYYYNGSTLKLIDGLSNVEKIFSVNSYCCNTVIDKNGIVYFVNPTSSQISYMHLNVNDFKDDEGNIKSYIKVDDVLPDFMKVNGDSIKYAFPISQDATGCSFAYIMNSGKVYMSGNYGLFGMDKELRNSLSSNRTSKIELVIDSLGNSGLSTLSGVKIVNYQTNKFSFCSSVLMHLPLVDEENNIYLIGLENITIGDSILVKYWKKIASNVSWLDSRDDGTLALVDKSGNGFVAFSDYRCIGIDSISEDVKMGNNFHKILNIDKIKKIVISSGATFVLNQDGDLYSAGRNIYDTQGNAFTGFYYNDENGYKTGEKKVLTLLAQNVKDVAGSYFSWSADNVYLTNDGKLFGCGNRNMSGFWETGGLQYKFAEITRIPDPNNISKMIPAWECGIFIMNDGSIYVGGNSVSSRLSFGGGLLSHVEAEDIDIEGNIIDVAFLGNGNYCNFIILTDTGNLYGVGNKQILGVDKDSDERLKMPVKLLENIASITNVSGTYLAVTNDGKVFGMGGNNYGILGRWIGVGRGTSNSRYKTPKEWVECPELEI